MNIFKRRERAEEAAETARWEAMKRATANPPDEIAKLRIELEEAQAYAESREKMRARWEILYWRQLERFAKLHTALDEARREVVEKTAACAELAGENKDLKQGIDAARAETRQAHQDRARAEQAAAEAERLHRERRLA